MHMVQIVKYFRKNACLHLKIANIDLWIYLGSYFLFNIDLMTEYEILSTRRNFLANHIRVFIQLLKEKREQRGASRKFYISHSYLELLAIYLLFLEEGSLLSIQER